MDGTTPDLQVFEYDPISQTFTSETSENDKVDIYDFILYARFETGVF